MRALRFLAGLVDMGKCAEEAMTGGANVLMICRETARRIRKTFDGTDHGCIEANG